jgi:hypothetical protein
MDRARLDDKGRVALPKEALSGLRPNSEFNVVREGSTLRLVPVPDQGVATVEELQAQARRYWAETTPEQRAKDFLEWANQPRPAGPPLPDEALHRESFYD